MIRVEPILDHRPCFAQVAALPVLKEFQMLANQTFMPTYQSDQWSFEM